MKISFSASIGISNRHVHLTKEDYKSLFGDEQISERNKLNQPGEFASNSRVTIETSMGKIENVIVLGPFRDYTQVEISKTDAYHLKLNPPVRKSGDIKGSEPITLIGSKGELKLSEGVIIANRHLHMDEISAKELGLVDDQALTVNINTEKAGRMVVFVKVTNEAYIEVHLDTDDANAVLAKSGDQVEVIVER